MAEQSGLQEEIDALKADLSNLRSDLSELTGAMREMGYSKAGEWRSAFEDEVNERREDLRRAMGSARQRGQAAEDEFERRVGEHPWGSLLAALGVGFLLAKVWDRGERR
jgi:ElaB/YqjD/DUF883 family membrane-anchored ribosome-binding protein